MTKLCELTTHKQADWGKMLYQYVSTITSEDTADMLKNEYRIARVLQDGGISLSEALWHHRDGLGLKKSRYWLQMGGAPEAIRKEFWKSREQISKQQFKQAMKRFCLELTE